jgi:excisionase family DNA binding protein
MVTETNDEVEEGDERAIVTAEVGAHRGAPRIAGSTAANVPEAAKYLNISEAYLYRLTSESAIPHYKPSGKKIYFSKRDLDNWLHRNRVKSREEIAEELQNK